jgi:hypothetical protein
VIASHILQSQQQFNILIKHNLNQKSEDADNHLIIPNQIILNIEFMFEFECHQFFLEKIAKKL